jgi:hypothetical protein
MAVLVLIAVVLLARSPYPVARSIGGLFAEHNGYPAGSSRNGRKTTSRLSSNRPAWRVLPTNRCSSLPIGATGSLEQAVLFREKGPKSFCL